MTKQSSFPFPCLSSILVTPSIYSYRTTHACPNLTRSSSPLQLLPSMLQTSQTVPSGLFHSFNHNHHIYIKPTTITTSTTITTPTSNFSSLNINTIIILIKKAPPPGLQTSRIKPLPQIPLGATPFPPSRVTKYIRPDPRTASSPPITTTFRSRTNLQPRPECRYK